MTISHFEPPKGLLEAFLDERQNWYPEEIHTLTGYDQAEFEALESHASSEPSEEHMLMMRQAANILLALPSTSDAACVEFIGSNWKLLLRQFLSGESYLKVLSE